MSDKPPPLLKIATDILGSQNTVAFVGNPGSGKTVLATLLKDAIFQYFGNQYADEFGINLIKGSDVLEETEQYIFEKKVFPPETDPGTQSELIFEIARKGPLGKKITIRIHDMSGDDYKKVFLGTDILPKTRLNNILTDKEKTETYGSLSFLIFAKLYVILIDCAEFRHWITLQTRLSQMLNSILGFKKELGETENNQFVTPLAIVLTKTDTLENGVEGSAENMLKKHMPQFYQTLNYVHAGKKEFFTVFIESDKSLVQTEKISHNPTKPEIVTEPVTEIETIPLKKLKEPINYSNAEYVKFILWLIQTIS